MMISVFFARTHLNRETIYFSNAICLLKFENSLLKDCWEFLFYRLVRDNEYYL